MKRVVLWAVLAATAAGLACAGHFELVWFRQWGYAENAGNHAMQIWVFDENGEMIPNAIVKDQFGVDRGWRTRPDGHRCEVALWPEEDLGFQCGDLIGSTSDVTPVVTTNYSYGEWGHYSYECGFVYKEDPGSLLDADDTVIGGVPQPGTSDPYCPITASMVYYSQNPFDLYGDAWSLGDFVPEHHQTFIAEGQNGSPVNRILGVFLFGVLGGNDPCQWTAEIREGGPDGPVIFSKTWIYPVYFGMPLAFGQDDCPVSPGEQYTITMRYDPGCNAYHVINDNYPNGYYTADTTPYYSYDMFGHAWGADRGIGVYGILRGTVSDDLGPLPGVGVTLQPGDLQRTTDQHGSYTYGTLTPGTYDVYVQTPGYTHGESLGNPVVVDETTRVDFELAALVNELRNPGFEIGTGSGWTWSGDTGTAARTGIYGIQAFSGNYMAVASSPSAAMHGYAQATVTGQQPGTSYDAGAYLYTYSSDFEVDDPTNCQARVGVDLDGGTDPAGVDTWGSWASSHSAWAPIGASYTATGAQATVFIEYSATSANEINRVLFDHTGVFNIAGGNPSSASDPGWFEAGWNLCSAPLQPADKDASAVFDDLVTAGNDLTNSLFKYVPGAGYAIYPGDFLQVDPGVGYWLYLTAAGTESITARIADDPTSVPCADGWMLVGHPHNNPTPFADCSFTDGTTVPAWHDYIVDNKRKYRSDDQPLWTWVDNARTAIEWRVWVDSTGSTSTSQPRVAIRDDYRTEVSYNGIEGTWRVGSNMPVTSGGIGGQVIMGNDEWHTVYFEFDPVGLTWEFTVDGKVDAYHHMEGTVTEATTSQYAQFGVLSSSSYCNMYTDYVVWGQGAEIGNWPSSKTYVANALSPHLPNGDFPGWGLEGTTSGCSFGSRGSNVKSTTAAVDAGWIEGMAYYYDAGYGLVRADGTGDDDSLRPWYGYWMLTNQAGLTMSIPK